MICCAVSDLRLKKAGGPRAGPKAGPAARPGRGAGPAAAFFPPAMRGHGGAEACSGKKLGRFCPPRWPLGKSHPIGQCPRAAAWPGGGGARRRMRPHTDAGFGALSGERGAYLPAERPSAASSAARLAATQQQRCRASTAPASQRRTRHPPSRARQGATVDARRLKAPRASHCSFFPPTHPACAGEFLGCAAASMSSATRAQRRLSTSNGGPSRPGEASPGLQEI